MHIMNQRNNLNEKEFETLVNRLSKRKKETQNTLSEQAVRDILAETGLIEQLNRSDIEAVRDDMARELKKRQRKKSLIINLLLLALISPALIFVGFKMKEVMLLMQEKSAPPTVETAGLTQTQQQQIQILKAENTQQKGIIEKLQNDNQLLQQRATTSTQAIQTPVASIPTPISPPQPNNLDKPAGTVLQPGQSWSQGGMELTLNKPSFTPDCREAFLEFDMNLVNNSGTDLVTNINGSDIALQMNGETASKYRWDTNNQRLNRCRNYTAQQPNKLEIRSLKTGENVKLNFMFLGRVDPEAQKVVVEVKKAGRIQNAKWEIPVPR